MPGTWGPGGLGGPFILMLRLVWSKSLVVGRSIEVPGGKFRVSTTSRAIGEDTLAYVLDFNDGVETQWRVDVTIRGRR
jgi:hypothetical protein